MSCFPWTQIWTRSPSTPSASSFTSWPHLHFHYESENQCISSDQFFLPYNLFSLTIWGFSFLQSWYHSVYRPFLWKNYSESVSTTVASAWLVQIYCRSGKMRGGNYCCYFGKFHLHLIWIVRFRKVFGLQKACQGTVCIIHDEEGSLC